MAWLTVLELWVDQQWAKHVNCKFDDADRRLLRNTDNDDIDNVDENNVVEEFPSRQPIICTIGYVDHGMMTLMDILRQRAVWTMGGMKKKKGKKKKGEKKNDNAENGDCSSRVAGTDAGGIIQIVSVP